MGSSSKVCYLPGAGGTHYHKVHCNSSKKGQTPALEHCCEVTKVVVDLVVGMMIVMLTTKPGSPIFSSEFGVPEGYMSIASLP